MDEYIKREDAIDAVLDVYCDTPDIDLSCEKFEAAILNIPAADVAEVRHGRWICINKRYGEYECSVCHGMDSNCSDYYGIHAVTEQEFCPSCGAKMDKEVADETCICQP